MSRCALWLRIFWRRANKLLIQIAMVADFLPAREHPCFQTRHGCASDADVRTFAAVEMLWLHNFQLACNQVVFEEGDVRTLRSCVQPSGVN